MSDAAAPSITCPRCGWTSHNANDIREGYCGHCHDWTRDDADDGDADALDLGPCCICETRVGVRNVVPLPLRGPIAGTGWGCIVCNLPLDGAVAVLCDGCLELVAAGAWPLFVCRGWPVDHGRAPFAELSADPFDHDLAAHQADDGEAP
jgi:hypothetical protein